MVYGVIIVKGLYFFVFVLLVVMYVCLYQRYYIYTSIVWFCDYMVIMKWLGIRKGLVIYC